MFTLFLVVLFFISVLAIIFVTHTKPSNEKRQRKLALYITSIRYYKLCADETSDGLKSLEYSKKREVLIDELLNYIENSKLMDIDEIEVADIIKLDEYRAKQSA